MSESDYNFDTYEKAEETRKANECVKPTQFCPLTNGFCRADCVCFQGPYIQKATGKYRVSKGYCGNAMFSNQCCAQ